VGKTQLAVSATEWIKAEKTKWSIFWVPAYSYAGFEKAFLDIARAIGVPPTREDKDFKSSVRRMLSSDRFGPWLLVVDNADDLNVLHGREGREGILQYLPQSIHGYTLFTTRSRDVALHVADDAILQLTPMAPGEAEELLRKSLHQERHPSDPGLTKALPDSLANIPLAIIQASAYLNRNIDVSIERYLQKLHSNEETLATIMNQDFYDFTRYSDLQNAIVGTWLLSFEQILRVDTYASYLLRFISCIEPVAIPMSILPDLGPNTDLDHAIGTLRSYAFLDRTNEEGIFEMHKLVHTVTRLWVRSQQLAVEASQQAIDHFGYTFPSADYRNRSAWRQYIPHTLKALACASDIPWDTCSQLYMLIGQCLRADGHFSGAIRSMECCISLQDHLPFTHVSKLNAQFQLAISYDEAGRSREAIPLLEHVVKVRRDLLGKEAQQDYLTARQTLAGAYQANGRLFEAITILEDVAKTRENVVPDENERHLSTLHDLAGAYLAGGRVKESITMLELVVSERLETHPRDHPELLAAQHVLASAYLADARIDRAIELLEYIGDIEEKTLDKDHPDRLESQHVLASAYLADGQVDRATSLFEFVVEKQQALGEEHPSLLCSQHVLAQAYQRAGRYASAIELLQKVVRVEEMALSADHPSRIESQKELARAQTRQTALDES
jgi:tetratricopeptide (TPR) repeat protein